MERQKLELLDKLDRAFPCAEEQIYKITVEIVVDVHAADFRLYSQKQCTAATKGFEIELRIRRKDLQMYGISFSLLPIHGINGLAIPATPVRGFREFLHCLLQAANCRVQTGAHFLELSDGGVKLCCIAGVKISLTAAGDGDSLAA